ncbi:hypothetical protein KFE25_007123 [Diacronema lutheri]|uniref:Right handed beta helix domain-containing protein n=1 Tax=Diacronema lutheri TaxID=2081491 RepID=A0A8J5XFV1_DIALT|nr:hypothetical protein KFE25_007123 [Diacronema lutheri]
MSTAAGSLALSVHAEATCITTDAHQLLVVAKLTGAPRAMRAQTAADACDSLRPRATGAQAHVRGAAEASAAESEVDDDDHVSLEQCGLGWRVCKPLRRRSPWALAAQRVTMRVETSSGARVEQLCLLEPAAMLGDGRRPSGGLSAAPLTDHAPGCAGNSDACATVSLNEVAAGESVYVPIALRVLAQGAKSDDPSTPAREPLSVRVTVIYFDCTTVMPAEAEAAIELARAPPSDVDEAVAHAQPVGARVSAAIVRAERVRIHAEGALAAAAASANASDVPGARDILLRALRELPALTGANTKLADALEHAPGSRAAARVGSLREAMRVLDAAAERRHGGWASVCALAASHADGLHVRNAAQPHAEAAQAGGAREGRLYCAVHGAIPASPPPVGGRGFGGAGNATPGGAANANTGAHSAGAGPTLSLAGVSCHPHGRLSCSPSAAPAAGSPLAGAGSSLGSALGGASGSADARGSLKPRALASPLCGCGFGCAPPASSVGAGGTTACDAGLVSRAVQARGAGATAPAAPASPLSARRGCAPSHPASAPSDGAQRVSTDGANGSSNGGSGSGSGSIRAPPDGWRAPDSRRALGGGSSPLGSIGAAGGGACAARGQPPFAASGTQPRAVPASAVGPPRTWQLRGRSAHSEADARALSGGLRAAGVGAQGGGGGGGGGTPVSAGAFLTVARQPAPLGGAPAAAGGASSPVSHPVTQPVSLAVDGFGPVALAQSSGGGAAGVGTHKPPPPPPIRLLRGRARAPPAQLQPLHAHPACACAHDGLACTASAIGGSAVALASGAPLASGAAADVCGMGVGVPGACAGLATSGPGAGRPHAEAWLCRLLGRPLPVSLPEDVVWMILRHVPPALAFDEAQQPPTLLVDRAAGTRGVFATISAALRAAHHGDRILVRPGVYRESLQVDVCVAIVGLPAGAHSAGAHGAQPSARVGPGVGAGASAGAGAGAGASTGAGGCGVVISSARNHALQSSAHLASVCGVTLRQTGSTGRSCLLTSRGTLEVRSCDVTSACGLCVEVTDGAAPLIRNCRVHEGLAAGLWFRAGGSGLVEGCEIARNGWSGVQISEGAHPSLLHNSIHDNKSAGIISFNGGRGLACRNEIWSNGKGGVQVRSGAFPVLLRNTIRDERSFGIWVYENGLGRFERNEIIDNAWSGLQVEEGSMPTVTANRLCGNRSAGIVVYNRGSGVYEWNDISNNGRCGVQIKSGSAPCFRFNRIHHEKQAGVLTAEDGSGLLEHNDIFDNQWSGVQTEGPSDPLLRRNRIHHNGGAGFIAYQNGSGVLEHNDIYDNRKYGVQSKTGGHPTVRHNRIHDKAFAIYLTEHGAGVFEGNSLHGIGAGRQGSGIYAAADCSPVLLSNSEDEP